MTVNSSQTEADRRTEHAGDPRIPYVGEIAVEAYASAVTLRGTVGSFAQQRAAVADVRRTRGGFDVFEHRRRTLAAIDCELGTETRP
jgi:osmotically-inducible protein OsmY